MKTISIIIATYNAAQTIERCIESIVSQKTDEIELIIIDGNSKDNTVSIINEKYKPVVDILVSEPDKGIYDAWNKGVKVSTGKWIMFLGADDIYKPGALRYYLDYLASNDCESFDLITGKCELVGSNGSVLRVWGDPYKWDDFRQFMRISHGSTLHNRKLFDELGGFDTRFRISGDYEFLLRKQMNARHVDKVILQMQFGGMSTTPKAFVDTFRVRRYRRSIPLYLNVYHFVKGLVGLYCKKIIWSVRNA